MEDKTLLGLYLSKVAAGDKSFVEKLCRRLADRLVFIPIVSSGNGQKGRARTMTLNVYRTEEPEREIFFIFTSERKLKAWSDKVGTKFDQVSLLGADFCTAMHAESWLRVDEGSENTVLLDPEVVSQIATTPTQEEQQRAEDDNLPLPQKAPATATPVVEGDVQVVSEPVEIAPRAPNPSSVSLQSGPREESVQITPEHLEALRASVASRSTAAGITRTGMQRPVIFSSAQQAPTGTDTEDDGKKKSLLGFLKSAKR